MPFQKGNKIWVGKKHTEETKKKMSEAKKGNLPWHKGKIGENTPGWKGGIIKNDNYTYLLKSKHPNADCNGYIKRANLIAEKALGRYLKNKEMVHHNNRKRDDDRNCNLLICTRSYHSWLHNKIRRMERRR